MPLFLDEEYARKTPFGGRISPSALVMVEVVEKKGTSDPSRGYVLFRDHVYNQHGDEVFHADQATLIRRRAAK